MAFLSVPSSLTHNRLYHWWLRLWYISARTPNFKPLLRAEFSNNDPFVQADFLFRAGYYNAAVCMSRFAVERRLRRLALITPCWREFRCKSTNGILSFLFRAEMLKRNERNRIENYSSRASKYVHETVVERQVAAKILSEGQELRPLLDALTSVALAM